jgi:hypothetical protein
MAVAEREYEIGKQDKEEKKSVAGSAGKWHRKNKWGDKRKV